MVLHSIALFHDCGSLRDCLPFGRDDKFQARFFSQGLAPSSRARPRSTDCEAPDKQQAPPASDSEPSSWCPTRQKGRKPSDIGLGPSELKVDAMCHEELVVPGNAVRQARQAPGNLPAVAALPAEPPVAAPLAVEAAPSMARSPTARAVPAKGQMPGEVPLSPVSSPRRRTSPVAPAWQTKVATLPGAIPPIKEQTWGEAAAEAVPAAPLALQASQPEEAVVQRPAGEPLAPKSSQPEEAAAERPVAEPLAPQVITGRPAEPAPVPDDLPSEENPVDDAKGTPLGAQDRPEAGDIVALGPGAPPEFRGCRAIVTKAQETFCTVVVLDERGRFGVGECWPMMEDAQLVSRTLRLGSRVLIDGLKGAKTRRLNGSLGTVAAHPREGHPTFVRAKASQEEPHLTVCVRLDEPPTGADRSVLLEPRFLVDQEKLLEQAAYNLGDALATLGSADANSAFPSG